jgi:hypothetical protein
MKFTVFCDVTPYSFVDGYQCFGAKYQTTWRDIPEDSSNIHTHSHQNLSSEIITHVGEKEQLVIKYVR